MADVGQEEDVNRIAEQAIVEFGGFTTWVNNAGVSIFGRCMEVTIPDMKRMFDTNFWGVVYGSRAAVNHFKQRQTGSGALINTGSFFGDRAVAVQSTYRFQTRPTRLDGCAANGVGSRRCACFRDVDSPWRN